MTLRIANFDEQPLGEFDPELADAVRFGDADRVSDLLASGADPDAVDSQGEHVLLIALRYEHPEIATKLVSHGARTDSATASGASPLWLASTLGFESAVRALVAAGASVNEAARDHSTPMSAALQAGHWSMAEFLRQMGGVVLKQDEFHSEMDRSYAAPGFRMATADTQEFRSAIAELQDTFDLKIVPNADCPGTYVCDGDALHQSENLQTRVREMSYSLIYDQLSSDSSPEHWILLPTDDKYPIIREIGPYSDRSGSDNQGLIWMLVDIDKESPFELIGCGSTFVHGQFRADLKDPDELAAHLMAVSPMTAKCFESTENLSTYMARTRTLPVYC